MTFLKSYYFMSKYIVVICQNKYICFLSLHLKVKCGLGVMEIMENWEEEAVKVARLPS